MMDKVDIEITKLAKADKLQIGNKHPVGMNDDIANFARLSAEQFNGMHQKLQKQSLRIKQLDNLVRFHVWVSGLMFLTLVWIALFK